ncbi:DUF6538 domain-containing protein [Roseomonas sp. BN140053]|uniref:DUF6538 domain-containing protein n=1 Tax=Roseomonas sp. BN140053 TaxID=3391898 RepID=UPI0039EA1C0D
MAAEHLRRRSGTYWFRRRVPDAFVERLGRREIHKSLRTTSPQVAAARGKQAWLATQTLFELMKNNSSLTARQAQLLIDQLLDEPLHASPTADELVAALGRGEGALARQLFNATGAELVMALPSEEQRRHVAAHMMRVADRAELNAARTRKELEQEKARLALEYAADAEERAADAESRASDAERQLMETEVARRVAHEVTAIVDRQSVQPLPLAPADPPPEKSGRRKAKPPCGRQSRRVSSLIRRSTRKATGPTTPTRSGRAKAPSTSGERLSATVR